MNNFSDNYADLILNRMICLKVGEKLSINCTAETAEFAHKLARMATEISRVPALIVFIENGKVESVDQFDPEGLHVTEEKGLAMVHLASFSCPEYNAEEELTAPLLQRFSLLSDPIDLERRIGVPWATIWVPTDEWARFVLGEDATVDQLWSALGDVLSLDEDYNALFSTQHKLLTERSKKLNNLEIESLTLEGKGTRLTLPVVKGAIPSTTASVLHETRNFFPTLPCEDTVILLDKTKGNGYFTATKPFKLFDKVIDSARFELTDGKITKIEMSNAAALFSAYLSSDADASRIGEVILCDELTRISESDLTLGIPLMDRMRSLSISLGGVDGASIPFTTMEEVEKANINCAFTHLEIPIGSRDMCVTANLSDGSSFLIMEDGIFQD
jgi:Leucyl aminopeptidase (aminopeptidase T)